MPSFQAEMIGFLTCFVLPAQNAPLVAPVSASHEPMVAPREIALKTPNGLVMVYLPNRIAAGDRISGSAFASSTGDWETQHRNLEYLSSLFVRVGDQRIGVPNTVFTAVAADLALKVDLEDASGHVLAEEDVQLPQDDAPVPSTDSRVVQAGFSLGVAGAFDGDRAKTFATINGRSIGVLAEGSHECYVTAPADKLGSVQFTVEENGEESTARVSIVSLIFLAPGRPTISGRTTSVGLDVEGLGDADSSVFPVTVELTVDKPAVAQFAGPDVARGTLLLLHKDLHQGHILTSVPIRARGNGVYKITGKVF